MRKIKPKEPSFKLTCLKLRLAQNFMLSNNVFEIASKKQVIKAVQAISLFFIFEIITAQFLSYFERQQLQQIMTPTKNIILSFIETFLLNNERQKTIAFYTPLPLSPPPSLSHSLSLSLFLGETIRMQLVLGHYHSTAFWFSQVAAFLI